MVKTISPDDKPARTNILALSKTDKFEELYLEWVIEWQKGDDYDETDHIPYLKQNSKGEHIKQCVCGCLGTNRSGLKYAILVSNIYRPDIKVWLGIQCQYLVKELNLKKINNKINHNYK